MNFILQTSFKDDTDGDLILRVRHMANILDNLDAYKTELPPWIPGGKQFREHADRLEEVVNLPGSGKTKEEERIAVREETVKTVNFAVQYITMYSTHINDPSLLENLGLEIKHKTYSRNRKLPGKVEKLIAKDDAEKSGAMVIQVNNGIGKKGSVELQITEGDPTDEASWRIVDYYFTCKFHVEGLEPVRRYHLRARFKNSEGNGPWSDVATVVVS